MKIVKQLPGILLGLGMLLFGSNKLLNFLPAPDISTMSAQAQAFWQGMLGSGYFLPFLGVMEVVGALLLLSRKFEALGALVLAPITVNIVVYHLATDMGSIAPGLILLVFNIIILFQHKPKFDAILQGGR